MSSTIQDSMCAIATWLNQCYMSFCQSLVGIKSNKFSSVRFFTATGMINL
ncbi:hypothetical protein H6F74_00175 [Trichocoleus sp. FACHB-90]|nr:hypothetical protein [Trichocoleus sp. FACHB-90]MBD1924709.1 hypothetical protein [Trichocoleus sp. FACHB-90]